MSMNFLQAIWVLLKATFSEWRDDKASRLAAALAYYAIFSLAPLLIIVIAIAGLAFGQKAVRGEIVGQAQQMVGQQGAQGVQTIIKNAGQSTNGGLVATAIGLATILFGATGVFAQLQDSLNTVWEVEPKQGQGIVGVVKDRFLSFVMVVGIGFLLLALLVISALLSGLSGYLQGLVPGYDLLLQVINFVISFAVITFLFAVIYKILPDAEVAWSDVWIGAAVTALLFTIGKFLIGLYLGRSTVSSTYGAAGSLVILLLWIYYSAQVLLFGAEFTQVYANKYGSRIVAEENDILDTTTAEQVEQKLSESS